MSSWNVPEWSSFFAIAALKSTVVLARHGWGLGRFAAVRGLTPPGVDRRCRGRAGVAFPLGFVACPARSGGRSAASV